MSALARLRSALESRWLPLIAALTAALLTASSLGAGLATEDFLFRAATQRTLTLDDVNLYDAEEVAGGVDAARRWGTLPWITSDDFRISFWRPVASLTHWLDYRLLPGPAWRLHLESIALYALAALAAAWLYRRTMKPAWVAGLAALFWAVDDAHGHAVGWLANRHAVLAAAFGIAAIALHDRFRRDRSRLALALSVVCLGLGLASSELALSAMCFILAHALTLDPAPPRRRLLALLPALATSGGWFVLTRALGHGSAGGGIYVDPLREPGLYLASLPERAGVLLLGQLALPGSDTWHVVARPIQLALAAGGIALALVVGWALWPRLTRSPELRFFAIGSGLALLPAATTFPSDRLLFFVGLGVSALVASLIGGLVERAPELGRRAILVAPPLALIHGVLSPLALPRRSLTMAKYHAHLAHASDSAYSQVKAIDELLVVVDAPDYYFCKMLREVRWTRGYRDAVPITCLVGSLAPTTITRIDPNAIEVRPAAGFLDRPFNRTYRSARDPMPAGQTVFTGSGQVVAGPPRADGSPESALFRFVYPLESDKLRFVVFQNDEYRPWTPPAIGASARLP